MAENCCVPPWAIDAEVGVIAMDESVGDVMVSVSELLVMAPTLAVIDVVPVATEVARPPDAMVALDGALECQVHEPVMSWVEESLYVPIAVNC